MGWASAGFNYVTHPLSRLIYGPGRVAEVTGILEQLHSRRALVVTSPSIELSGLATRVTGYFPARLGGVFAGVRPHSPIETVEQALAVATSVQADAVVSLGGGSCVDTAKGVVHLHRERTQQLLPHVAIPTTLSGAEFSGGAGITHGSIKKIYRSELYCESVLLDPEVAITTPLALFLPSGFNAIAHCIEGLSSVGGNGLGDALMLHAIRLLAASLIEVKRDPTNRAARGRAQVGAALAALGCWEVPVGLEHALAHVVGGKYKVPHAIAHALLIAPVMRFNHDVVVAAQVAIAEALGVKDTGLPPHTMALRGITRLEELLRELEVPTGLRSFGVEEAGLNDLAEAAREDPCFPTNPRPVRSSVEIVNVLREAL